MKYLLHPLKCSNTKIWYSFVLFVVIMLLAFPLFTSRSYAETIPGLTYTNKNTPLFKGQLVPDPKTGVVLRDKSLFGLKVDDNNVTAFTLSPATQGQATIKGNFPYLNEGEHTGVLATHFPDLSQKDNEKLLFIVDVTPPELSIISPDPNSSASNHIATFRIQIKDDLSGIPIKLDDMEASASINGKTATINQTFQNNQRFLLIDVTETTPPYNLTLSLKDRAGNEAILNQPTSTEEIIEETKYKNVTCTDKDKNKNVFELPVSQKQSFPIVGQLQSLLFHESKQATGLKFVLKSARELSAEVLAGLSLTCNHPAVTIKNLPVERVSDGYNLRFWITQTDIVSALDAYATILVTHPQLLTTESSYKCSNGVAVRDTINTTASTEQSSFEIPLSLYFSDKGRFDWSIDKTDPENPVFVYKVEDESGKQGIDLTASWLEFNDEKATFDFNGKNCFAKIPAKLEGKFPFSTLLSSNGGLFNGQSSLTRNGTVDVVLAPPVITGFHYDREQEKLVALIADQGTPLAELGIELDIFGQGKRIFTFNAETGQLVAPFPLPQAILNTRLTVTDNVGQQTHASCKIFGQPPENPNPAIGKVQHTVTPGYSQSVFQSYKGRLGSDTVLSNYGSGCHLVQTCRIVKIVHYNYGIRNVKIPRNWKSNDFGYQYRDKFYRSSNTYTKKTLQCETAPRDITPPLIKDVAYNPAKGTVTATIDDHGMPVSQVSVKFFGGSNYPNYYEYFDSDLPFSLAPKGTLNPWLSQKQGIKGYGRYGLFKGYFSPPPQGEFFTLTIYAKDKAGNDREVSLNITMPRRPPKVTLELSDVASANHSISHKSSTQNVIIIGRVVDVSGINQDTVVFTMDNQQIQPLSQMPREYIYGYDRNLLGSYYIQDYSGIWGMLLEEGPHHCKLRATDAAGLTGEATLDFSLDFHPVINKFVNTTFAVQNIGGPALTASIVDFGGDLQQSGISLKLDNSTVEPGKIFFDPVSGYFAVDGPLELGLGSHIATLTAIDDHGNKAEKTLRFAIGDKIDPTESFTDLRIDGITLWELLNQNGDGLANPGETVRLFISLFNDSGEQLKNCVGRLESEDNRIAVETNKLNYRSLEPGVSTLPLQGFDLQIDADILDNTISSPYDTHHNLLVKCENHEQWQLSFKLPIFKPSIPVNISSNVQVKLDRLPYSTSKKEITVRGVATSTQSFVEQVILFVNGVEFKPIYFNKDDGTFEFTVILQDGSNLIEVHGLDQSGAMGIARATISSDSKVIVTLDKLPSTTSQETINVTGNAESSAGTIEQLTLTVNGQPVPVNWHPSRKPFAAVVQLQNGANVIAVEAIDSTRSSGQDQAFVQRLANLVPPEINITDPANGEIFDTNFPTNPLNVQGTFNVGNSTLSSIVVTTQWGGACTTTVTGSTTYSATCSATPVVEANYTITATITTENGQTASKIILITTVEIPI